MSPVYERLLIIADIEGSSGCWCEQAARFRTPEWAEACGHMSMDVHEVVQALFQAGVKAVTVKDFHRTGYNLLPELIDPRARIIQGFQRGPIPGVGQSDAAEAVIFLGLHAASGTDGFLAHTLTSRIGALEVNGRPLAEVELFSAALAPYGVRPILFQGGPVACRQAESAIPGIVTHPIDKSSGPEGLDAPAWRAGLARAAVGALQNREVQPYRPPGPFRAVVTMRDGEYPARKVAERWGFDRDGPRILIEAADIHRLLTDLIRLAYLTPWIERVIPLGLIGYRIWGRWGLAWARARRRLRETPSARA